MDNKMIKNKKGQVAIWVILAILIVFAVLLYAFVTNKTLSSKNQVTPELNIQDCAKNAVNQALEIMLPQGGFISPMDYKIYNNTKVAYLCQNIGDYKPCINQHPEYINEITEQLTNYTLPMIQQCFDSFQNSEEQNNVKVTYGQLYYSINLAPDRIFLNVTRDTTISINNQETKESDFSQVIVNPIYDLGNVAMTIANQEAKYCYFEYVGYMLLYPKFTISKFTMSDSTRIYTIKDNPSGQALNIAIRGCAIPPGI